MAKQCSLNTLITLFSLHKILQKINQIMKILRALKIFSSRMFFFPKHLLHAPGRLQTFIQSWKQKYSDQALLSTHVLIWNSHIETLQCLTYTSWTSEKGLNSSFSFLCYACLKREKGTPSTQHCHPPPPKKKRIYPSNPLSNPPEIDLQNFQTFLNGKNFSHNVGGFSWFPAPTWGFFSPGVHGLVLSFFSLVLPRGSISNGSRIPLVGNGGSSSVHAFTFNLFHDKHSTRKFWNES